MFKPQTYEIAGTLCKRIVVPGLHLQRDGLQSSQDKQPCRSKSCTWRCCLCMTLSIVQAMYSAAELSVKPAEMLQAQNSQHERFLAICVPDRRRHFGVYYLFWCNGPCKKTFPSHTATIGANVRATQICTVWFFDLLCFVRTPSDLRVCID